jgi:hypothetical protein
MSILQRYGVDDDTSWQLTTTVTSFSSTVFSIQINVSTRPVNFLVLERKKYNLSGTSIISEKLH